MQRIKTNEQWREVLQQSKHNPCLMLKFSMTCISSISALKEFKALETNLPKYLVIVQKDRDISNIIEKELKESPQLLILKDGKGIWQATHYKIKKALCLKQLVCMFSEQEKKIPIHNT
ncbi:monothiol bacilliredoxin BrxC family protein [Lysinibacillus sp. NPDC093190]|uniref:monothiol bacilliredoxin BrxC family protein n=1 Tax=Lysinibacillus sp. NPDC093190 TaxID=3390575 RepID=UPI003D091E3D